MKKRILTYSLLVFAFAAMISCKKDEKYAPKVLSDAQIQFQVDDKALTGTVFAGAVQPNATINIAKFSKATTASPNYFNGNIVVTANLSSNVSNLKVFLVFNTTDANGVITINKEEKASFTGVSGSATWTQSIAALTQKGVAVTTTAGGTTYNFEFVASNDGGSITTTRLFQASLAN